jgi:hypothetical protein
MPNLFPRDDAVLHVEMGGKAQVVGPETQNYRFGALGYLCLKGQFPAVGIHYNEIFLHARRSCWAYIYAERLWPNDWKFSVRIGRVI